MRVFRSRAASLRETVSSWLKASVSSAVNEDNKREGALQGPSSQ